MLRTPHVSIEYDVTLKVEVVSSDDSVDNLSSNDLTSAISDIIDETDEIEVTYDQVLVDSDETEIEVTTFEPELVSFHRYFLISKSIFFAQIIVPDTQRILETF